MADKISIWYDIGGIVGGYRRISDLYCLEILNSRIFTFPESEKRDRTLNFLTDFLDEGQRTP